MKRSRKRRRSRKPPVSARAKSPSRGEAALLALAARVSAVAQGARDPADAVADALHELAAAFEPDAELPRAVARAWLASRGDKTAALALSWAREQLRVAVRDVVDAERAARRTPGGLDSETVAWLILAACEAIARQPASAGVDRLPFLLRLARTAATP